MMIVVHREALRQVHGPDAWEKVHAELRLYTAGLKAKSIQWQVVYLDAPESGLGPPAAPGDAPAAVRIVRAAVNRSGQPPNAILLIGGPSTLPFCRVTNKKTLPADLDTDIPTDNHYGSRTDAMADIAAPAIAVGRMAIGAADPVDGLVAQLRQARQLRSSTTASAPGLGTFVASERQWLAATQAVAQQISAGARDELTTPFDSVQSFSRLRRNVLFFNTHGSPNTPNWFGRDGSTERPAITPGVTSLGTFPASIVFACNCYGANPAARSARESIALTMMQRGAACVIAATGYSFGALQFLFENSEELAFRFFTHFKTGMKAGLAFGRARREFAIAHHVDTAPAKTLEFKTAFQFVFLGDPML